MFQSTRPRGARPLFSHKYFQRCPVSIHAPARGATQFVHLPKIRGRVSIHAPARGATNDNSITFLDAYCFNPRARAGRDRVEVAGAAAGVSFNPRARAGRDQPTITMESSMGSFQSTRPRGARRGWIKAGSDCSQFQSTRPRGARQRNIWSLWRLARVSIHAPARGATLTR